MLSRLFSLLAVLVLAPVLVLSLNGCALPQVSAEERLFLDISLDFLSSYTLPPTQVDDAPVGGLSAITYDRQRDRLYALSDDRSNFAPARFYTLKLEIGEDGQVEDSGEAITLQSVEVENVTYLTDTGGSPFPAGSIDPEGIALSPRQSLFIADEGDIEAGIAPRIQEFDQGTGRKVGEIAIPQRFLPGSLEEAEDSAENQPRGVQNNRGFESLSLNPGLVSNNALEPFRLFAATEANLLQDQPTWPDSGEDSRHPIPVRLLHYVVGDRLPLLLAEHLYLIDPPVDGGETGLTEILALDQAGHFLTLERSFKLPQFSARLYQMAIGGATDTSGIPALVGNISGIETVHKRLVLDLQDLDIPLDNLEGMTLGPQLPDGSQSLLLVSDNNFNPLQQTQILLFRFAE
jgi:hypothetical protein